MFFDALAQLIARMATRPRVSFPDGAAESLLAWLRDGKSTDGLDLFRTQRQIPRAFIEDGGIAPNDPERRALVAAFAELPDPQALRFGELLVAVYNNPAISAPQRLRLPADASWVEYLVRFASAQVNVSSSVNAIDPIDGLDFAHLSHLLEIAGHQSDLLLRSVNDSDSCIAVPELRLFWCTMPGYAETARSKVASLRECLRADPRTSAATLRTIAIATPELLDGLADAIAPLAGSGDLRLRAALAMAARYGGDALRSALADAGLPILSTGAIPVRPAIVPRPTGWAVPDEKERAALVVAVGRVAHAALDPTQVAARDRPTDGSQGDRPIEPDAVLLADLREALVIDHADGGRSPDALRCSIAMRDFVPAFFADPVGRNIDLAHFMRCVMALNPQIGGSAHAVDEFVEALVTHYRDQEKPDLRVVREHLAAIGIRRDALLRRLCAGEIAQYVAHWPAAAVAPLLSEVDDWWRLPLEPLLQGFQPSPDGHPLAGLIARLVPMPDVLADFFLEIALAPPAEHDSDTSSIYRGQERGRPRAARRALMSADVRLIERLQLATTRTHAASALAARAWLDERKQYAVAPVQPSPSDAAAWIAGQVLKLRALDLSSSNVAESAVQAIAEHETTSAVHLLRMLAAQRIDGINDRREPWFRANAALYRLAERRKTTVDELVDRSVPVSGFGQPGVPPLAALLNLERARLQAAMDLGRRWKPQDWESGIAAHLLLRRLARSLVWLAVDDQRVIASFRPDAKGVTRDSNGALVTIDTSVKIVLAHQRLLDSASIDAWRTADARDGIEPVFRQFGRVQPTVSDDPRWAQAIENFKGQRVARAAFDAQVAALGYEARRVSERGTCIYEHTVGDSPAHRVELEIERDGEEVVLSTLYFRSTDFPEVPLPRTPGIIAKRVPPILVAERCSDLAEIVTNTVPLPVVSTVQAVADTAKSDCLLIDADLSADSLQTAGEFLVAALLVLERLRPSVEGDWLSPLNLVAPAPMFAEKMLAIKSITKGLILNGEGRQGRYERELKFEHLAADVSPLGRAATALLLPTEGVGPSLLEFAAEALSLFGRTWVVRSDAKRGARPEKLHDRQNLRTLVGTGCYGSGNGDIAGYARAFEKDEHLSSMPVERFWGEGGERVLDAVQNWRKGGVAAKWGMEDNKRNSDQLAAKIWAWTPKRMLIRKPDYPSARVRAVAIDWHTKELPRFAPELLAQSDRS
ncbi:DUF4132 domain-containing protein [Hydrogenophaga sp. PAMC20947]|uniref:DUF4132 domain-containing protein n=1 Tax=Hydrogenophaga sp. PAMC20947 TaxID=2565558 RepID=UPI001444A194|nr:DUF4132 domain-containing protein [Hydrogenophaga sp. PAMC20947]